jgi:hypothetical protein
MRLSEDRVSAIAYKIAFALVKKRFVKTTQNLRQVTAWVERPILDNLAAEARLDEDARAMLRKMSTCPPEGSFDWQALFQKKKEELAAKRQYEL